MKASRELRVTLVGVWMTLVVPVRGAVAADCSRVFVT